MSVRPIRSPVLDGLSGIRHGFFTRAGGVSPGILASLNCGTGSGLDSAENVRENRARAAAALGLPAERIRTVRQTHGAIAVKVDRRNEDPGRREADAVVSRSPGIAVAVTTADCAPVLLAEPFAGVVAAAHAGWRGALGGILESAVRAMETAGAHAPRIVAAVGPTVTASHYEVGPEFRERFLAEDPTSAAQFRGGTGGEPVRFDLPGYVVCRLAAVGVGCVEDLRLCTYADETRFFSCRRARHRGEPGFGLLLSAIALT